MNAFRVILQPSGQIRRCDIGNAGRFRPIPANQIVADRIRLPFPEQFPLNLVHKTCSNL